MKTAVTQTHKNSFEFNKFAFMLNETFNFKIYIFIFNWILNFYNILLISFQISSMYI